MNASSSYPYTFEEEKTCADPLEEVARKGPNNPSLHLESYKALN